MATASYAPASREGMTGPVDPPSSDGVLAKVPIRVKANTTSGAGLRVHSYMSRAVRDKGDRVA